MVVQKQHGRALRTVSPSVECKFSLSSRILLIHTLQRFLQMSLPLYCFRAGSFCNKSFFIFSWGHYFHINSSFLITTTITDINIAPPAQRVQRTFITHFEFSTSWTYFHYQTALFLALLLWRVPGWTSFGAFFLDNDTFVRFLRAPDFQSMYNLYAR